MKTLEEIKKDMKFGDVFTTEEFIEDVNLGYINVIMCKYISCYVYFYSSLMGILNSFLHFLVSKVFSLGTK